MSLLNIDGILLMNKVKFLKKQLKNQYLTEKKIVLISHLIL